VGRIVTRRDSQMNCFTFHGCGVELYSRILHVASYLKYSLPTRAFCSPLQQPTTYVLSLRSTVDQYLPVRKHISHLLLLPDCQVKNTMPTNVTTPPIKPKALVPSAAKIAKVAAPKLATTPPTLKKQTASTKSTSTRKVYSHQHRNTYKEFCYAVERVHAAHNTGHAIKPSHIATIQAQPGGPKSGHYYEEAVKESLAEHEHPERINPQGLECMLKDEQRRLKVLYPPSGLWTKEWHAQQKREEDERKEKSNKEYEVYEKKMFADLTQEKKRRAANKTTGA
jgi:hypothetical protein